MFRFRMALSLALAAAACLPMAAQAQADKARVPGAANIEWRQVFAQRAQLPRDKTLLVYCNTSSFAAQVAMAPSAAAVSSGSGPAGPGCRPAYA